MSSLKPRILDYNLKIDEEHENFRQTVREFAKREVEGRVQEIERSNAIPPELIGKMSGAGLFGVSVSEAYEGVGGDALNLAMASEEIARVCVACSAVMGGTFLVTEPLQLHGTEEQKRRYLAPLARGEKIGAHAMTEPAAGSDIAGIQSTAKQDGDKWVVSGRKLFITNGDIADVFLVFARSSAPPSPERRHLGLSAYLIEKGTPGFTVAGRVNTLGLRGSQPAELVMEDVRVSKENLLGKEGHGAYIALEAYDRGRIGVAAQGVGLTQAAYEAAASYAAQRIAFGSRLIEFQQVQFKLAEVAVNLHAARLLAYWAASLKDQGKDFIQAASVAKVFATEAAEKAALTAIMIHGGYGVATEFPVERYLRDSQIIKTYEGTNDIQKLTIARQLVKELGG